MAEKPIWRHTIGIEKRTTGNLHDEGTPRVSFITTSNNFQSFDILPGVIRLHDISRYPSVGLSTMQELQDALSATRQPEAPAYAETLFEIGKSHFTQKEADGISEEETLKQIYKEWKGVLEEQVEK